MAQTSQNIGQALECSVRLDYFNASKKRPRILTGCGHSFCVACIRDIQGDNEVKCPTCRQDTPLVSCNIDKLPTDFTALTLLNSLCKVCKRAQWTTRCPQCSMGTCAACQDSHVSDASQGIYTALKELQAKIQKLEKVCKGKYETITISYVQEILKNEPENNLGKLLAHIPGNMESLLKAIQRTCVEHIGKDMRRNTHSGLMVVEPWAKIVRELANTANVFIRSTELATKKCHQKLSGRFSKKTLAKCEVISRKVTELDDQTPSTQTYYRSPESLNTPQTSKSVENVEEKKTFVADIHTFSSYVSFILRKYRAYHGSDMVPFAGVKRHISTAVSPVTGNIAVIKHGATRVMLLDNNLNLIRYIGSAHPGSRDGAFRDPFGVTFNSEGQIFVSDKNNHRIQVFLEDGKFVSKYGSRGSGTHQFIHPQGIAFDCRGLLCVCDSGNNRIHQIIVNTVGGMHILSYSVLHDEPKYRHGSA